MAPAGEEDLPNVSRFRRLRLWECSFELALDIIRLTNRFPDPEGNGLAAEIRAAAVLIPSYLADTPTTPAHRRFVGDLYQSLTSLARVEIQILISAELGYLNREELLRVEGRILGIRKLAGESLRRRPSARRPGADPTR